MRLVLVGAPGSGKGTQGTRLAAHLGVARIATGDLMRAESATGSPLGAELSRYLGTGDLVPDEVVLRVMWQPIAAAAAAGGYVLDGFPRTRAQAVALSERGAAEGVDPQLAVHLDGEPEALVQRMLARARDGGRPDDVEPVIRHRLEVFEQETKPVLDHYARLGLLARVDAMGPVDEVFAAVLAAVERARV